MNISITTNKEQMRIEAVKKAVDGGKNILVANDKERERIQNVLDKSYPDSDVNVITAEPAADVEISHNNMVVLEPDEIIKSLMGLSVRDGKISDMIHSASMLGSVELLGVTLPVINGNEETKIQRAEPERVREIGNGVTIYRADEPHNFCANYVHHIWNFCGLEDIPEGIKNGTEKIVKIDLTISGAYGDMGEVCNDLHSKLIMPDGVFETAVIKDKDGRIVDIVTGYMDNGFMVHFSSCNHKANCIHVCGEIQTRKEI